MDLKTLLVYILLMIILGYFLGIWGPVENDVSIEYVNGLLTMASILSSFLAAILTIEPKNVSQGAIIESLADALKISFFFLGIALFFYSLSAFHITGYLRVSFIFLLIVILFDIFVFILVTPKWIEWEGLREKWRKKFSSTKS